MPYMFWYPAKWLNLKGYGIISNKVKKIFNYISATTTVSKSTQKIAHLWICWLADSSSLHHIYKSLGLAGFPRSASLLLILFPIYRQRENFDT